MTQPFNVGFLLYPNLTQLDLTGPAQFLSRAPGARGLACRRGEACRQGRVRAGVRVGPLGGAGGLTLTLTPHTPPCPPAQLEHG